jgi:hypothetical protein
VVAISLHTQQAKASLHWLAQRTRDACGKEAAARGGDEREDGALAAIGDGERQDFGVRSNGMDASGDGGGDCLGVETALERLGRGENAHVRAPWW